MSNNPRFRVKSAVRTAIAKLNISQNQLARSCGITSGYLSQLLSGKRCAGPVVRARLLEQLDGLAFDDLFEELG
jgi:transcriptional regulator with XRE-family HTH domain